jgi:hypothetical protein
VTAESIQPFFALAIGFALAGLLASGYQLATLRAPSFRLLERGPKIEALAAVPFLAFAAPFIIMRNTILGSQLEGGNFTLVMAATVIACFWSLMSGSVVMMALNSLGVFQM